MDEVWMHSVAPINDGKLEVFKRLAQELLSTIREKDLDTLNHASLLDESSHVAVFSSTMRARRLARA